MEEVYDAAVIGAGIVGASTAWRLLSSGMKVVLIDRRDPGRETSFGNTGIIESSYVLPFGAPHFRRLLRILLDRDSGVRLHYPSIPKYLPWLIKSYVSALPDSRMASGRRLRPLVSAALEEHRTLMRKAGVERLLVMAGKVQLFRTRDSFLASEVERNIAREMSVPFEVYDAAAFADIEPHLLPTYDRAVLWSGGARVIDPAALVKAYASRFIEEGGEFQRKEVVSLQTLEPGEWRAQAKDGAIRARHIVVCAGPWSAQLLGPLGYRLPLGLRRGYHRHFAALGEATLSHAIVDSEFGYLLAQMTSGLRLTTGVEFASLEAPPRPEHVMRLARRAREIFPLGAPLDSEAWFGDRPCFPDSLPVVGPALKHSGLWLNIGHGHLGLTIGPPTARLLAEMMTNRTTFCSPEPYSSCRFSRRGVPIAQAAARDRLSDLQ